MIFVEKPREKLEFGPGHLMYQKNRPVLRPCAPSIQRYRVTHLQLWMTIRARLGHKWNTPWLLSLVSPDFGSASISRRGSSGWRGHNDVRTLQNLLNCPRSPNVRHECGAPLLHAAAKGYMEPLQLLIEAAADLNARDTDPQGWTALLLAAQFGHVDSVHSLIETVFIAW